MLITYAVFAKTPIGVVVLVLKVGAGPELSGSQAANRVTEVEDGKDEPAGTLVPFPSAAVFQPANL